MTKTDALSRRKLLGRIGLLAAAGYTIPALTTLSVAQAGSGPSGGGASGGSTSGGSTSGGSTSGGASSSNNSGPSGAGGQMINNNNNAAKLAACGPEDLNSTVYMQCLIDNGF